MTKKLRIRFVLISMIALIVMQSIIILFSIQRSYSNMVSKADDMISDIKNSYPKDADVDARYFVATIVRGSQSRTVDLEHISSVKRDGAQNYIRKALGNQNDCGFVGKFRYRIFRETDKITIVFLSRNLSLEAIKNTLTSSVLFSILGLSVMLVFLILLSGWVTRPIAVSDQKQKEFITSASHELGTPLTVIKADAEILLSSAPDNEWVQDIHKQAVRLTDMTHNMITLAKMEEQNRTAAQIEFPVSDLAEDIAKSYRGVATAGHIQFKPMIQQDMSYCGDENLIRQLFTILLDNAFKYCTPDGEVEFTLQAVSHGISVCVTNTAHQIKQEQVSRFFDRFYRSENAEFSQKKGFGLGLSIANVIVKSHRGKITAKAVADNRIQITALLR